jgi:hypothetical protein
LFVATQSSAYTTQLHVYHSTGKKITQLWLND